MNLCEHNWSFWSQFEVLKGFLKLLLTPFVVGLTSPFMTLLVEKKDIQENVEDVLKFCLQYMLKMGCHGATELNCTYR